MHYVILSETRMRHAHVTPLGYLEAKDTSGGVERQKKITHAHESPFYHCGQFPHPFAITSWGKKIKSDTFWTDLVCREAIFCALFTDNISAVG
jgi:hypothetical protein